MSRQCIPGRLRQPFENLIFAKGIMKAPGDVVAHLPLVRDVAMVCRVALTPFRRFERQMCPLKHLVRTGSGAVHFATTVFSSNDHLGGERSLAVC